MPNTWSATWMDVAVSVSKRSKCSRRQVGAVIVSKDNRILSTGYNGPARGLYDTSKSCVDFCPRAQKNANTTDYGNCISIHAEANALLYSDYNKQQGSTIYTTSFPCWDCAKLISNSGIGMVVSLWEEYRPWRRIVEVEEYLMNCGIDSYSVVL